MVVISSEEERSSYPMNARPPPEDPNAGRDAEETDPDKMSPEQLMKKMQQSMEGAVS